MEVRDYKILSTGVVKIQYLCESRSKKYKDKVLWGTAEQAIVDFDEEKGLKENMVIKYAELQQDNSLFDCLVDAINDSESIKDSFADTKALFPAYTGCEEVKCTRNHDDLSEYEPCPHAKFYFLKTETKKGKFAGAQCQKCKGYIDANGPLKPQHGKPVMVCKTLMKTELQDCFARGFLCHGCTQEKKKEDQAKNELVHDLRNINRAVAASTTSQDEKVLLEVPRKAAATVTPKKLDSTLRDADRRGPVLGSTEVEIPMSNPSNADN